MPLPGRLNGKGTLIMYATDYLAIGAGMLAGAILLTCFSIWVLLT